MELNGARSNPQGVLELFELCNLKRALLQRKGVRRRRRTKVQPRTRVPITKTITQVLELANYQPMAVKDIHRACEELLHQEVSYRSVKASLSEGSGWNGHFVRIDWGMYRGRIGSRRDAK